MGLMSHRENSSSGYGLGVVAATQAKRLSIHPLYPTAHHRPCHSQVPPPPFSFPINYFSLHFSRNKKKRISVARNWTQCQTYRRRSSMKNMFLSSSSLRGKNILQRRVFQCTLGIKRETDVISFICLRCYFIFRINRISQLPFRFKTALCVMKTCCVLHLMYGISKNTLSKILVINAVNVVSRFG